MFVVDDSMLGTKASSYWLLMLLRLDVKADLFGVGLPDQDILSTAILWREILVMSLRKPLRKSLRFCGSPQPYQSL